MSLDNIKMLGPKRKKILNSMGIYSVEDLVYLLPNNYEDRSVPLVFFNGKTGWFEARVISKSKRYIKSGRTLSKITVSSDGYVVDLIYFSPYAYQSFKMDKDYVIYGKLDYHYGNFEMVHPSFIGADDKNRASFLSIQPVYPYIKGIPNITFSKIIKNVLETHTIDEVLLEEDLDKFSLIGINEAFRQMHYPTSRKNYARAKYRLIFNEFFNYLLDIRGIESRKKPPYSTGDIRDFKDKINFSLTSDQEKTIKEIKSDFESDFQMIRMLQGDVGSGKSIVAYYAIFEAYRNSFQSAYLAPTQLLASQHYQLLSEIFSEDEVVLIDSNTTGKKKLYSEIKSGKYRVIVGTHAIFQDELEYNNLDLIVIDEQHRFGINQRNKLLKKGNNPNLLMMSATPIPRTLSMVLNRSLNVSYLEEKPSGRIEIKTKLLNKNNISKAYAHVKNEILKGHKAYIVYARIEESEDIKSIESEMKNMKDLFGDDVIFLHGKMKAKEKTKAIEEFKNGSKHVLVSTTVVEVGIDVSDASVMIINDSHLFGLSQLHQIRGRVGRSNIASTVYMITDKNIPERLRILEQTTNGFEIADADLKLRGPGEIRGLSQHGKLEFKLADISKHSDILKDVDRLLTPEKTKLYISRIEEVKF